MEKRRAVPGGGQRPHRYPANVTTDDAHASPLPPGFTDVELLAATGCGPLYRARVAAADGRVENVAVTLVKSSIRDRGARRRLRSDCLSAVAPHTPPAAL